MLPVWELNEADTPCILCRHLEQAQANVGLACILEDISGEGGEH